MVGLLRLPKAWLVLLVVVALAAVAAMLALAPAGGGVNPWDYVAGDEPVIVDHTRYFEEANITKYEGSKTCMKCHRDEVEEVFHSYHYQLRAPNDDIAGGGTVVYGSAYAYNDYCGAIFWRDPKTGELKPVNWIGKAVLKKPPPGYEELKGKFIASGCSMCHGASLGLVPSPVESEEQLYNIDCLVCHSTLYKGGPAGVKKGFRLVVNVNGSWRYVPNPDISVEELASSINARPTKDQCLYCHAYSGGGPGYKRPNLSPDLMGNVSEEFDVHMASGVTCIDCHRVEDHSFKTLAADTWSHGEPGEPPACTACHGERPHTGLKGAIINEIHLDKVACQTCHIPLIAHGVYPTDMARYWNESVFHPEAGKYEPKIDLEGNVTPVYRWYNGTRRAYIYPQPAEGRSIVLAEPLGSKDDPRSKIYPFKLHVAYVPYDPEARLPVPVKVGIVFATGNTTLAAMKGAEIAGLKFNGDYVKLVRYMQVNHGVKPADEALGCLDCHGPTIRRMPWPELGYGHWPEVAFNTIIAVVAVAAAYSAYRLFKRRGAGA